jgi:hypothetical protein
MKLCNCHPDVTTYRPDCPVHGHAAAELDMRRMNALEGVHLRWHDFGGEWNVWRNGQKFTGSCLRSIADKLLAAK